MNKLLVALLAVLLSAPSVFALTASVTGTQVTVNYVEPNLNKDGSTLVDLDKTTIYYDLGAGPVAELDVVGSTVTGGGNVNQQIVVPVAVDTEANVDVWATATDTSGNESLPSSVSTVRVDRLAPAAPQ